MLLNALVLIAFIAVPFHHDALANPAHDSPQIAQSAGQGHVHTEADIASRGHADSHHHPGPSGHDSTDESGDFCHSVVGVMTANHGTETVLPLSLRYTLATLRTDSIALRAMPKPPRT